ncbi:BON domain-containing protein [Novipirellula caenicola]|uniref:BON domain-containing protein n=1 Tax=Novipirellula caenicola TaxID=1536901 RepID=A0ABP9VHJ0_9BACT
MKDSIESRLRASLQRLGFNEIEVASDENGHVRLSGTVNNSSDRTSVLTIARTTPGVKRIANQVNVLS